MADTKISNLTALAGADVDVTVDVLPIVDTGVTTTKKILVEELAKSVAATQAQVNAMTSVSTLLTPNINKIVLGTEAATTSGTEKDFTSIPSGVRRINVMFVGVSTNGSSDYLIQLGDSGGFENTGYTSAVSTGGGFVSNTTGFLIADPVSSGTALHGHVTLLLEDSSDFTWTATGVLMDVAQSRYNVCAGSKSLSAELSQIRITTVSGDTFDAGAVNISFER